MNTLSPIKHDALAAVSGVRHSFFTRPGGLSLGIYAGLSAGLGSDDERDHVVENRRRMAEELGVGAAMLASPHQVHSPDVVVTNTAWNSGGVAERPKADGIVTTKPGLAIGIFTADCGPVLFADGEAGVIGACHAGWKGALGGVLENTIEVMCENGAERANITAILGPTISQKNYQVGPGFPDPFLEQSPDNASYFASSDKPDHYQLDLTGYIVDRIARTGVKSASVERCTYEEEDNFYSYRRTTHRREADYGRQLSAIVLNAN